MSAANSKSAKTGQNGIGDHGAGLGGQSFDEVLDILPAAIYMTDAEGFVTHANAAAVELAGRAPVLGVDRWCVTDKLFTADGKPLPHDQCPMATAMKEGRPIRGAEAVAERPDGSRFWFTPFPTPLKDANGKVVGGINMLVDITHRKRTEEALRRSEELFRGIFESSSVGVAVLTPDARFERVNPAFCAITGYSAGELLALDCTDITHPDDIPPMRGQLEQLLAGATKSFALEKRYFRKDGSTIWVRNSVSLARDPGGKAEYLTVLCDDITARKDAEKADYLLAAIVDSSDDAIVSKNLDSIITSWNKSAERVFGYTAEEIVGKSVLALIPEDRQSEETDIIARLHKGERIEHFETVRKRKDGTLIDVSLTISPVKDPSGRIVGASKIARDITAQKRAENELRRANQDLEQFAFSASHDLQEPLRTIKIYSELLGAEYGHESSAEAKEYFGYLRSAATRMELLVRDLLAYTRASKFEAPVETVDANAILAETLAALRGAIAESGAHITSDRLPEPRVHGMHLQQLFQNLIVNAIKYRDPARPPVIHVAAQRRSDAWMFSVKDNAVGIDPQYKEKIFGLFTRLNSGDNAGTGIGLAICQRIVERYHGRIWVESEPGRGSTFRFTLPV